MDHRTLRRLGELPRRDRLAALALAWLLTVAAAMILAPLLSSYDPTEVDYPAALQPPSRGHVAGTDNFGRDVFTRLVYGGRASLLTAMVAAAAVIMLSLAVGTAAGFAGGWVDIVISRLIDVVLSYPGLVLAIAIAALVDASAPGVILAIVLVSWPGYARIFRSSVLQLKQELYIDAARCAGTPAWRIVTSHAVGAMTGPILVLAAADVGQIVLSVSALSFLGLGFKPPTPEWGAMLSEARAYVEEAPWMFMAPGAAVVLVVLSVNYLGDAVRDALDPRRPRIPDFPSMRTMWREAWSSTQAEFEPSDRRAVATVNGLCVDVKANQGHILQDVSLKISAGECIGIVGESGAGKSTLGAALMGLLRPPLTVTSGDVRLFGESTGGWTWNDWRRVRGRHVALINQDPLSALNPLLTIGDQIGECIRCHHRVSRQESRGRVGNILDRVHLPAGTADEYPHELSGGMRQRVAIAMALVNEPSLIIADEPTTALDVSTQARVLEELAALQRSLSVAMVLISHDIRLVANIADRIVVMKEGRIVEEGATRTVLRTPSHEYTKLLLAAVPRVLVTSATGTHAGH